MLRSYSPGDYWNRIASTFGHSDEWGYAPILHPDAPAWFNLTIDRLQRRSWHRAVVSCGIHRGSRVLDVGCGTGRWLRRYSAMGLSAVGVDATPEMLARAAEMGTASELILAPAQHLPFENGCFDFVSAVTVVQHVSPSDQPKIIGEMARILRPGGRLLLIELIRGSGPHIFPRRLSDWCKQADTAGLMLESCEGQEFLLFDRAFVSLIQAGRRIIRRKAESPALPAQVEPGKPLSFAKRAYWSARRVTCTLSEWVEPAASLLCPKQWATHGLFLFRK